MRKIRFIGLSLCLTFGVSTTSAYYYGISTTDPSSQRITRQTSVINPIETATPAPVRQRFDGEIIASVVGDPANTKISIFELNNGEEVLFAPDQASFDTYDQVTWNWHYDSRGLHCSLTNENELLCTVVNAHIGSDVWASFTVPNSPGIFQSNKIGINREVAAVREEIPVRIPERFESEIPSLEYEPVEFMSDIPEYNRTRVQYDYPLIRPNNYYNFWRYPYYSAYYSEEYRSRFPRYYQYWY